MPKLNVYAFEAEAIRNILAGDGGVEDRLNLLALAEAIEKATGKGVTLPGPEGEANVEVPSWWMEGE